MNSCLYEVQLYITQHTTSTSHYHTTTKNLLNNTSSLWFEIFSCKFKYFLPHPNTTVSISDHLYFLSISSFEVCTALSLTTQSHHKQFLLSGCQASLNGVLPVCYTWRLAVLYIANACTLEMGIFQCSSTGGKTPTRHVLPLLMIHDWP